VEVEFSLIDGAGVHLFDSHPSLLQKRGTLAFEKTGDDQGLGSKRKVVSQAPF